MLHDMQHGAVTLSIVVIDIAKRRFDEKHMENLADLQAYERMFLGVGPEYMELSHIACDYV